MQYASLHINIVIIPKKSVLGGMQTTVAQLANTSETKLKGKFLKTEKDLKSSPKRSIHDSNLKLYLSK